MALNYDELMSTSTVDIPCVYSDTQTMLYALSIGLGRDSLSRKELAYVQEHGAPLQTLPTMATALVPDMIPADLGWDYSQVLHVEQRLQLYRPLPPAANLLLNKSIVGAIDRGPAHGAMILLEVEGRLAKDNNALFTLGSTIIARGDGGFGGPKGFGPTPHRVPRRDPDLTCDICTRPDQSLLYRLNGDRNPLHVDPASAGKSGFPRPILHGLCTYGIASHAILKTICDYDGTLIAGFEARFSAPVFPGETIRTEMRQDGNVVSFQCAVNERDSIVLRNGKCTLAT